MDRLSIEWRRFRGPARHGVEIGVMLPHRFTRLKLMLPRVLASFASNVESLHGYGLGLHTFSVTMDMYTQDAPTHRYHLVQTRQPALQAFPPRPGRRRAAPPEGFRALLPRHPRGATATDRYVYLNLDSATIFALTHYTPTNHPTTSTPDSGGAPSPSASSGRRWPGRSAPPSVWKAEVEGIHFSAFIEQPAVAGEWLLVYIVAWHGCCENG